MELNMENDNRKWLCDVRSGIVAVYWAEKYKNCLSGCKNWSIFVRDGIPQKYGWILPKKYIYQAKILTWILNIFKCQYLLSNIRD